MNFQSVSGRALASIAALSLVFSVPATAYAADSHYWFWTTAGDANPLPYSECQRRATGALSSAGLSSGQMGTNPDTFYGQTDTVYVMLMCISQPRGFFMVLDVSVNGGSRSSVDIGNAVNNAFWGTTTPTTPSPPGATTPSATGGSDWAAQANQFRGQNGARYTYYCPPNGTLSTRLWGTDLYTDDSSVCTAAVHSGLINTAQGGTVTIEIRAGAAGYTGSTRYGVSSNNYGSWYGSFAFVGQPSIGMFQAVPATPGTWRLASNCGWGPGGWQATLTLNQAPDGSLSGTVLSDNNNTGAPKIEVLANGSGYGNANPTPARSAVVGNTMGLFLHPSSWVSVLQLSGQINGNQISGGVHHYGNDDCTFTMTRS